MRRSARAEALVGAHDADVVPHESPELVPVLGDDDGLVARARLAGVPLGHAREGLLASSARRSPRRRGDRRPSPRAASSTRGGSRRGGPCTRPRRSPRGRGSWCAPRDPSSRRRRGSAPPGRPGSARLVMSMPNRLHCCIDVREVLLDEARRLVRDVEPHVLGAGALHLEVDGAGDDVARRELAERVVLLHEGDAVGAGGGRRPRRGAPRSMRKLFACGWKRQVG